MTAEDSHYCEGSVRLRPGGGFFRPGSRPARDLGVLLARQQRRGEMLQVLDLMAGCGIRALRYGLEAGATHLWVNDGDPGRLPLLRDNLRVLADRAAVTCSSLSGGRLLQELLHQGRRFCLIDIDAFGCPAGLIPPALEALRPDGVLYLTCSDGRSATGHDRKAALRRFGAAARVHPAGWETALRLQLGMVARAAWATGRGIRPLFSLSDGRTFRTAIRLRTTPSPQEEVLLGLTAHCPLCGDQQVQSLLHLRCWRSCLCGEGSDAPRLISGPLWIGPLQDPPLLGSMAADAATLPGSLGRAGARLLRRLEQDPGSEARCWPLALIGRCLGQGPPPRAALIAALERQGHRVSSSGIMPGQVRCDASWATLLATAAALGSGRDGGRTREAAR